MANGIIGSKLLMLGFIVIVLIVLCRSKSTFSGGGGVIELNPSNFDKTVQGDYIVFVKYIAPWCGHCKSIEGPWKDLAKAYENDSGVVIAEVNADMHKELGQKSGVQGFPTIIAFKGGKSLGKYNGARDVSSWKSHIESIRQP